MDRELNFVTVRKSSIAHGTIGSVKLTTELTTRLKKLVRNVNARDDIMSNRRGCALEDVAQVKDEWNLGTAVKDEKGGSIDAKDRDGGVIHASDKRRVSGSHRRMMKESVIVKNGGTRAGISTEPRGRKKSGKGRRRGRSMRCPSTSVSWKPSRNGKIWRRETIRMKSWRRDG